MAAADLVAGIEDLEVRRFEESIETIAPVTCATPQWKLTQEEPPAPDHMSLPRSYEHDWRLPAASA